MPIPPDHPLRLELADSAPELLEGDESATGLGLRRLTLTGGTELKPPAPGVTVVVGGNNVGKSTLLREVHQWAQALPGQRLGSVRLVESPLAFEPTGTPADLVAWLVHHARFTARPGERSGLVPIGGAQLVDSHTLRLHAARLWSSGARNGSLWPLAPFLVSYADTAARLDLSIPAPVREDVTQPPTHPVHALADDPARLARADELCSRIFGQHLVLDELSARNRLRVSPEPLPATMRDGVVDRGYRAAVVALPELAEQGDGMRSLLGLLLPLLTVAHPLVLVDEPEAFLHPPQAVALGSALAELTRDNQLQLILATHDRSLLSGLLQVPDVEVTVVRLDRPASGPTVAHQLDAGRVRALAGDTVLRYSNALDGLFHRRVVLAEGSDDCSFYAASLNAADSEAPLPVRPSEVLLVPCSGKAGMAPVARALRALAVPVVATPDLDVLNDKTVLRALVEALGGDWGSFERDYGTATNSFRQPRDPFTARQVQQLIDAVLAANPDAVFDSGLRARVNLQLRAGESSWQALKDHGMTAFQGGARQAADRLLNDLDAVGLIAVREGELEQFAPGLGVSKGAGWLPAALKARAHEGPAATAHARKLVETAGSAP